MYVIHARIATVRRAGRRVAFENPKSVKAVAPARMAKGVN
jgi:hypothetical protein